MAKTSKKIEIKVTARDKASRILHKITASFKKWGGGALKITAGVVAGVGAVTVALGAMFSKLSDSIDEQAKMASALGLSNEALGVMRDAAGYAGISVSNLNTALRKMSQSVADAADGTGEAKDALEALGLDAAKLQQMGPEKAFKEIIRQLDQIPNGLKKTQIAMDIFGRSGASMTNLTSRGLRQAQKDAEDLGIKLSSAQAANVEASNDAWSRIKNAVADFLKYITATLAPGIKKGFDSVFAYIKTQNLKKWAVTTALTIAKAFQSVVIVLGAVGEGLIAVTRGLITAFKLANDVVRKYSDINYLASKGSVAIAEQNMKNLKEQGVPESNYYYQETEKTLVAEREKLRMYQDMSYQAALIDESMTEAAAALNAAQGFSSGSVAEQAVQGLQEAVDGLNIAQENTAKTAEKTGGTMKIAFSGTAEAAEIAGNKMERINNILAEMKEKAQAATSEINKIPAVPLMSVGSVADPGEGLSRQLEEMADH